MKRYGPTVRPKPKPRPPEFGGKPPAPKPVLKPAPKIATKMAAKPAFRPPVASKPFSPKPQRPPQGRPNGPFTPKPRPFAAKPRPFVQNQKPRPFAGKPQRPMPPRFPAQAAPSKPSDSPATHWGPVAEWYDQLVGDAGSEYHQKVVLPGVMRLLKPKTGQRVLDVACGQGVLCRLIHERGAETVGVDAARPLIEMARKRSNESIAYHIGDARHLSLIKALEPESFDAATSVLAIQNIDPIAGAFKGIATLIKPGGKFVLVMMHPAFRGPKETFWGWDDDKGVQFRRVDRYLIPRKELIVSHPGKKDGTHTWSFHRPLHTYVRAMAHAGLLIEAMEEWTSHKFSQPGARSKAENIARKEIPMFLALRAVKVTAATGSTSEPESELESALDTLFEKEVEADPEADAVSENVSPPDAAAEYYEE